MNPYSSTDLWSTSPVPPVIQTSQNSAAGAPPPQASPGQNVQSARSNLSLPAYASTSVPVSSVESPSSQNPYPPSAAPPPQVTPPSPDLGPSPRCPDEPDLECSICFSQFNNIFRCPKMLYCKHTFCLECLVRINVKSSEPSTIQCPLCRGLTPLPALGLPKLTTDQDVLSYLPAAMQRIYSVRFLRNKGKLQVKRSTDGPGRQGGGSLTSQHSINHSIDVGIPSPTTESNSQMSGVGGALFRLTGRPACRAFLLTSVVMMMVLLTGIIIFLLVK